MMSDTTETRVAVLEKEMDSIGGLFDRLDKTIESLTDISGSVKQLLAVHDSRLDNQEKQDEKLHEMIEKRRNTTDQQYEALHKRIGEVKTELNNEIDKRQDRIEEMMKELKDSQEEHHNCMLDKITKIEKWRWSLVGGAVVLGFLIAEAEFLVKLLN